MEPLRRPEIVIGLDVGKSSRWACVAARDGEMLASKPVANTRRSKALPRLSASPSPNLKSALSPKPKEGRTGISRYAPQFNLAASLPSRDPSALIPLERVAYIHLVGHVGRIVAPAVGHDYVALGLELDQIVRNLAAEELQRIERGP